MDTNDWMDRALEQARSIQKTIGDAAGKSAEQMKPLLEQSVQTAQELQATLSKHAVESAAIAHEHSQHAIAYLEQYMKLGREVARTSAQHAQELTKTMMEHGRAAVEQTMATVGRSSDETGRARK